MAYTTIPKSTAQFAPKLYVGNSNAGSPNTQSITGLNFQPDFTWCKNRDAGSNHALFDAVRGVTKLLNSNTTTVEATVADTLTAFDTNGFTLGTDVNQGVVNNINQNFVSWNWKANGAGSTNTDGSIDSTVSVNTASGFSIVKVLKSSSAVATIGHGLGVTPKMFIVKSIDAGNNWQVYHEATGATKALYLNGNGVPVTTSGFFNNTAPTSTVLTLGSDGAFTGNTMIIYCFADVQGFSKMGSYVGTGNVDGNFVYLGFKPAFVMIKAAGTENWVMDDSKRLGYNVDNRFLVPNQNYNESGSVSNIDLLSNGFKLRSASGYYNSGNSYTYIYAAFAEEPLVSTNGIPATAR